MEKGLELELVGAMIIALVGIALLLMFVSSTTREAVSDGFCYLTQKIGMTPQGCTPLGLGKQSEELDPKTPEALALEISGRSIRCWQESIKTVQKKEVPCAELYLNTHPGPLSETDFTRVMEEGGGCEILQNYMVVDGMGNLVEYGGDCGDQEQIDWKVSGNVIDQQSFIRIVYDTTSNKIVIKA